MGKARTADTLSGIDGLPPVVFEFNQLPACF
jgi:hypothetical protein